MDEKIKSMGDIGKIPLPPLPISLLLCLVVVSLIACYTLFPPAREVILFGSSCIAVAIALIVAYYRIKAIQNAIIQQEKLINSEMISNAFRFIERWNDPTFAKIRAEWRKLITELENMTPENVIKTLNEDAKNRTVAVDILNFYEEMGYSARSGLSDIPTLKKLFKTVATNYFDVILPWIQNFRTIPQNSFSTYEHFEWLRNKLANDD